MGAGPAAQGPWLSGPGPGKSWEPGAWALAQPGSCCWTVQGLGLSTQAACSTPGLVGVGGAGEGSPPGPHRELRTQVGMIQPRPAAQTHGTASGSGSRLALS